MAAKTRYGSVTASATAPAISVRRTAKPRKPVRRDHPQHHADGDQDTVVMSPVERGGRGESGRYRFLR